MDEVKKHYNSRPDNKSAMKHGGAAAVKAIERGEPLRGPAREAELAVVEALETEGSVSLERRGAVRLQAAADCYWGAFNDVVATVVERGGASEAAIVKLTGVVKTFGWLQSSALRAWAQVREAERQSKGPTLEVLLSQEADGG